MSRFNRLQVLNTMVSDGFVPLYYNGDTEIVKQVIKACYDGGSRIFEFTNRGDYAHEVFAEVNKWATKTCPEMILGVGSVVDGPACSLYIQLGANFIVSPLLNTEMAKVCNRRKVAWIPGCATISEISTAEEAGAEIVKIFPGNVIGGPAFVKSVTGPCPWTSIMASGGVTTDPENLKAWFDAGSTCVGLGSQLFKKEVISEGKFDEISTVVRQVRKEIQKFRIP